MRGKSLHNHIAFRLKAILESCYLPVSLEHYIQRNGTADVVDILVQCGKIQWAIEIETTIRHALDNANKAAAVDIPLWIVVPTSSLAASVPARLKPLDLHPGGQPIKILLLGQVQKAVTNYLSEYFVADKRNDKQ